MPAFPSDVLAAAMAAREVEMTTTGRASGRPHRTTLWIWGDGTRLFVRSGGGLGRDWPQNLLADPAAVLHLGDRAVPVRARPVTDPAEARQGAAWITAKYGGERHPSPPDGPLDPAEAATFELLPDDGAAG